MVEKKIVFLSHAAVDHEIAATLKVEIVACFPSVEVFVSSDPDALPPRDPWVQTILANLKSASLIAVLATPRGIKRNWVWFEAGTGWQETPRFTTCCLGIHKGNLPAPFALYTALDLSEPVDVNTFFSDLTDQLGAAQSLPNPVELCHKLIEIEKRTAAGEKILEDPLSDERWKNIEKVLNQLDPTGKAALRLLLHFGSATDYFALKQLRTDQLAQNMVNVFPGLQLTTNLVRLASGQSDRLRDQERLWELKPELEPFVKRYFTQNRLPIRTAMPQSDPAGRP